MDIDCDLKRLYFINHSIEDPWFYTFILIYVLLIVLSLTSNMSVIIALQRIGKRRNKKQKKLLRESFLVRPLKPSEKTKVLFITLLASVDIILSLTIPFTTMDGLSKFWPVGKDTEILCKLTKSLPSVTVFSSSALITIIALNSYRQVLSPHKAQILPKHSKYILFCIFCTSVLFTIPQFYHTKLFSLFEDKALPPDPNVANDSSTTFEPYEVSPVGSTVTPLPQSSKEVVDTRTDKTNTNDTCSHYDKNGWSHVVFCIEQWPFTEETLDPFQRVYYSYFTFTIQLILPFIVISVSYLSIYLKLQKHSVVRQRLLVCKGEQKIQDENRRNKRRNKLMVAISLVYLGSWLPLGTINVLLDTFPDMLGTNPSHATILFVFCHIIGMCSTSVNPIIYGFTNKSIRAGT